MIWWLYECLFWIGLVLISPYYVLRMKRRGGYARDFLERFGVFDSAKRNRLDGLRPIWIHAVSVGEVDLALQLIAKLRNSAKTASLPLALSTTTSTGHALAAQKLPPDVPLFYYPLDSRLCFERVHRLLQPVAFILVEAELWPNHLRFCAAREIPLLLINARLSERRYPRYRRFRWFLEPAFRGFRLVTLQSVHDQQRLAELGFPRESLVVLGSLKYDTAQGTDPARRERLAADLALFRQRPLWVAGSTHPGEEEIVLDIFTRLRTRHPTLLLGLAPRHVERAPEIAALLRQRKISHVFRSRIGSSSDAGNADVLLLDTTGELKYLYELATVIFIGKSLTGHGGQNPIEPAACGKPVLFGPHMENFEFIVRDFLDAAAAVQVRNATELDARTMFFLDHPEAAAAFGDKARQLVQSKRGGIERSISAIRQALDLAT